MPRLAVIGYGAMARYVAAAMRGSDWDLDHCIVREGREDAARNRLGKGIKLVSEVGALPEDTALVVDCAGHGGLKAHDPAVLRRGVPMVTASLGALADSEVYRVLSEAALAGGVQLHLASGAIGGLDALAAARLGGLDMVTYEGRKPPEGWRGSAAEEVLKLDELGEAAVHFEGSARDAALRYPKNANVAAAVALAGPGFLATKVRLIADPAAEGNMHRIIACGAFGEMRFDVTGQGLPDTPRTSALAAMSMVERVFRRGSTITF